MADKTLKSAYELAMERLMAKDKAEGVEQRPVTEAQKAAIAEIRNFYESKMAEAQARRYEPAVPVGQSRARARQLLTDSPLVKGTPFARGITARWAVWEKYTGEQLAKKLADQIAQGKT